MKVLAHIRKSLGSYGRPSMTIEPNEAGLEVGERRVEQFKPARIPSQAGLMSQVIGTKPGHVQLHANRGSKWPKNV